MSSQAGDEKKPGLLSRFRRKRSGPRKPPQMWVLFKATREVDPAVVWWMLGAALVTISVVTAIGAALSFFWMALVLSVPLGFLAALIVLGRRAEKAMFQRMDGQPGAAGAALSMIRRGGWTIEEQPVNIDPRTKDAVFRGYSKRGVVLVAEGTTGAAKRLLDKEVKHTERILPGVPVHAIRVGNGEGQTPLKALPRTVMRLKGKLTRAEVDTVGKRLRSMGGLKAPIPRGVDPTRMRPDRKAMRGR